MWEVGGLWAYQIAGSRLAHLFIHEKESLSNHVNLSASKLRGCLAEGRVSAPIVLVVGLLGGVSLPAGAPGGFQRL